MSCHPRGLSGHLPDGAQGMSCHVTLGGLSGHLPDGVQGMSCHVTLGGSVDTYQVVLKVCHVMSP